MPDASAKLWFIETGSEDVLGNEFDVGLALPVSTPSGYEIVQVCSLCRDAMMMMMMMMRLCGFAPVPLDLLWHFTPWDLVPVDVSTGQVEMRMLASAAAAGCHGMLSAASSTIFCSSAAARSLVAQVNPKKRKRLDSNYFLEVIVVKHLGASLLMVMKSLLRVQVSMVPSVACCP